MNMDGQKDPVAKATGLTKIYRDFWRRPRVRALDGIDLDIAPGEVFGLLGPNGSGKSTTIKLMLGLLNPSAGSISVLGRPPRDVSVRHRIGYMPEESHLYRYLTAAETLDFYGSLFGLGRHERHERSRQLLDMVGLSGAADRRIGEYSKGMARRVGLAQALINDPDLVILDEPTAGLDPVGCREFKDLILKLSARGKTVILASHLLADVEDVCSRVAILYNGKIRAQGDVNELLEKKDRCSLALDNLPPETMKKVLEAVRREIGKEPAVEYPKRNLEEFFLDVVRKAQDASGVTSGAARGGGMAQFLAARENAGAGK